MSELFYFKLSIIYIMENDEYFLETQFNIKVPYKEKYFFIPIQSFINIFYKSCDKLRDKKIKLINHTGFIYGHRAYHFFYKT